MADAVIDVSAIRISANSELPGTELWIYKHGRFSCSVLNTGHRIIWSVTTKRFTLQEGESAGMMAGLQCAIRRADEIAEDLDK